MGTFERDYEVDGEHFELYGVRGEDGRMTYQLVGDENLPVGGPFDDIPEDEVIVAVVRAAKEIESSF